MLLLNYLVIIQKVGSAEYFMQLFVKGHYYAHKSATMERQRHSGNRRRERSSSDEQEVESLAHHPTENQTLPAAEPLPSMSPVLTTQEMLIWM